jgi:MarR family transcriptional regulator, 2-MHQ and catechol-resistance regulon repressor
LNLYLDVKNLYGVTERIESRYRSSRKGGIHLWLIIMKAHQALSRHAMRSIAGTGLCFSDFAVLEILLHKGPLPVNTLGAKVDLTSGSATAAIDRLVRKGLARRGDDPHDRRARIVHLTAKGRRLIEKAFREHELDMEEATRGLTNAEKSDLADLLKKLGKSVVHPHTSSQKGATHVKKGFEYRSR